MAKVLYLLEPSQTIELEVSDGTATALSQLAEEAKREEWRNDWRLRKKLVSMDKLSELGMQFRDYSPTPEEICIENEEYANRRCDLQKGLSTLSAYYVES